jgi:dipeptide transport system substrate-binding protein
VTASGYDGRTFILFFANGGMRQRAVELLQADWAKAGVKVMPRAMELGELYKRAGEGEHDIALLAWYGDNGDPDNFFSPNLSCPAVKSGGNKDRWCNPKMQALLDAATSTSDVKQRAELYRRAQRLVYDEVPVVPTVYVMDMTAMNKRVHGYVASPFGIHDFRTVSVDGSP